MKKLEDIPKMNIHKVPDGYFDRLPGIIQSRINQENDVKSAASYPVFGTVLKYAMPVVLLIVAVIYWIRPGMEAQSAEDILASIETEYLIEYLEESGVTTDELLETVDLTEADVDDIESSVYFNFDLPAGQTDELDLLLKEYHNHEEIENHL